MFSASHYHELYVSLTFYQVCQRYHRPKGHYRFQYGSLNEILENYPWLKVKPRMLHHSRSKDYRIIGLSEILFLSTQIIAVKLWNFRGRLLLLKQQVKNRWMNAAWVHALVIAYLVSGELQEVILSVCQIMAVFLKFRVPNRPSLPQKGYNYHLGLSFHFHVKKIAHVIRFRWKTLATSGN